MVPGDEREATTVGTPARRRVEVVPGREDPFLAHTVRGDGDDLVHHLIGALAVVGLAHRGEPPAIG